MRLYLFGKFGLFKRYIQVPCDKTTDEIKKSFKHCIGKETIVILRKDKILYYIYFYKFSKYAYCGLCHISDVVVNDVSILLDAFHGGLDEIAKRNEVLQKDSKGEFKYVSKTITADCVSVDKCNSFVTNCISNFGKTNLPNLNFGVNQKLIAKYNLSLDSIDDILDAVKKGYHTIIVSKDGDYKQLYDTAKSTYKNKDLYRSLILAKKAAELCPDSSDINALIEKIEKDRLQIESDTENKARRLIDENKLIDALITANASLARLIDDANCKNLQNEIVHKLDIIIDDFLEKEDLGKAEKFCENIIKKNRYDNEHWEQRKLQIERSKAKVKFSEGLNFYKKEEFDIALKSFKHVLQIDSTYKARIDELIKQLEDEKSTLINNKNRKLRELRAECKAQLRKGHNCISVINHFLDHCHNLGIKIYDTDCENLLHELKGSNNKKEDPETVEVSTKESEEKESNDNPMKPEKDSAQSLFLKLQFKEAAEQFQKEGKEEMVNVCSKFRRIQKIINQRKKELSNSTFDRAPQIIKELQDFLQEFKDYQLPILELKDLINQYKQLKK